MKDNLDFNLNSGSKISIYKDYIIVDNFYNGGQADVKVENNNIDHVDIDYVDSRIFLIIYTKDGQVVDVLVNEDDLEIIEVIYSYLMNPNHYILDFEHGKLVLKKPYKKETEPIVTPKEAPVEVQRIIQQVPLQQVPLQQAPITQTVENNVPFVIQKISWGTKLIQISGIIFKISLWFIGIMFFVSLVLSGQANQYVDGGTQFTVLVGIFAYTAAAVFGAWIAYVTLCAWGEFVESKFIEREIALQKNNVDYKTKYDIEVK